MATCRVALVLLGIYILSVTATANIQTTDRLIAALKKKNMYIFMEELSVKGLDVNAPDSLRRLPIIEAVRARDQRAVLALLEQGALSKIHEPGSGITPLHVAFQNNYVAIARALLAHGANPNAKDKSGAPARSFSPSKDIADMAAAYDAKGSVAFECPPGTWLKKGEGGSFYFWSPSTGESRWTPPPSCAWQRFTVQGQPIRYINSVTGQSLPHLPPALSWTKVRAPDGALLWLNWAAGVSAPASPPPAELPEEMVAELGRTAGTRWMQRGTGTYSYIDPSYATAWRELHDQASKQPFYFNIETGESVWDPPEELAWTKMNDTDGGLPYYFNRRSGEVSWNAPSQGPLSFVIARDDSEL